MKDTNLHFEAVGGGAPPVLLLHGVMFDGTVFTELADHLAPRHEAIAVDIPGFGRSAPASGFSPAELADPVARLLRERGGAPAIVFGWSMGATVAMQMAIDHPDLVDRLVLLGATPCLLRRPDWPHGLDPEAARGLGELLATDWEAGADAFVSQVASRGDDAVRARLGEVARRSRPESSLATFAAASDLDLRPALDRIEVPVHLIVGEDDAVCPPAASRYLSERLGAPLTVLEGADHAAFLTAPDRFRPALDDALDPARPPAAPRG